jgi:hypothetical protein
MNDSELGEQAHVHCKSSHSPSSSFFSFIITISSTSPLLSANSNPIHGRYFSGRKTRPRIFCIPESPSETRQSKAKESPANDGTIVDQAEEKITQADIEMAETEPVQIANPEDETPKESGSGKGKGKAKSKGKEKTKRDARKRQEERPPRDPDAPKEPRLPKKQTAILMGFCGSNYHGMQ